MGLDQYAFARKGEPIRNRLETEYEVENEIAYWRKHPNLQGWMENLWRKKGGEGEFNCVEVELTFEDLEQLETAIERAELPETQGFFFGFNSDDEYKENDQEFIREARQHIADGYKVVYTSWW